MQQSSYHGAFIALGVIGIILTAIGILVSASFTLFFMLFGGILGSFFGLPVLLFYLSMLAQSIVIIVQSRNAMFEISRLISFIILLALNINTGIFLSLLLNNIDQRETIMFYGFIGVQLIVSIVIWVIIGMAKRKNDRLQKSAPALPIQSV